MHHRRGTLVAHQEPINYNTSQQYTATAYDFNPKKGEA